MFHLIYHESRICWNYKAKTDKKNCHIFYRTKVNENCFILRIVNCIWVTAFNCVFFLLMFRFELIRNRLNFFPTGQSRRFIYHSHRLHSEKQHFFWKPEIVQNIIHLILVVFFMLLRPIQFQYVILYWFINISRPT